MRRTLWLIGVWCAVFVVVPLEAQTSDPFALENEAKKVDPKAKPKDVAVKKTTSAVAMNLHLQAALEPTQAKPGQVVRLTISGKPDAGYHTYPIWRRTAEQPAGQLTRVSLDSPDLKLLGPVKESAPVLGFDKSLKAMVYKFKEPFTWTQDILVLESATPGRKSVPIKVKLMVCSDRNCTSPDEYPGLETALEVLPGPAVALTPEIKDRLAAAPARVVVENVASPTGTPGAGKTTAGVENQGLTGLLGTAFVGAFLMLLTPCVFPMIPITVNFFLKQSEKEHHRPFFMASVYSGTIIFLLTFVILVLGKMVVAMAINPWFNLALGAVLVFFALSLFGMYEIELPSGLARYTSAHEGQGGYIGVMFMALTFTITSFTCTGPFLGVMLAPIAGLQPPLYHLILAALVYSTTFAAPFFVLALFPSMIKKLPKSGSWLNSVKVTMGFLELGAALKFLSNSDMTWFPGNPRLFNYDTVLCAWIALSVACGVYLIGAFRLPHDDPIEHIGVVRMLTASLFFGLAVYMTPALRGEKPEGLVGESIVAFLPPSYKQHPPGGGGGEHLSWHLDYVDAWNEAKKENKLIFIDFTGVTCTNCRDNEQNVFPRGEVASVLKKYVRVQLYTDTVPNPKLSSAQALEQAERNRLWRDEVGKELTNPCYLIFRPSQDVPFQGEILKGELLGKESGTIFDVPGFVAFLQRPQQEQVALGARAE